MQASEIMFDSRECTMTFNKIDYFLYRKSNTNVKSWCKVCLTNSYCRHVIDVMSEHLSLKDHFGKESGNRGKCRVDCKHRGAKNTPVHNSCQMWRDGPLTRLKINATTLKTMYAKQTT